MNRYNGNTGSFERVPDTEPVIYELPPIFAEDVSGEFKKPSSQSGIPGGLGGMLGGLGSSLGNPNGVLGGILGKHGGLGSILSKFSLSNLELEDIMLVGVLYLLYRESGDIEFLLIAGAMLFL